jgi:monoamine oxidase
MLINGWHARSVSQLSSEERKSIFAKHLVKLIGSEEALHPVDYVEKNWLDEPFSDGCYGAAWLPGTLSIFGHAITKQHARGVFFAGSETATEWAGYVEGAISSGYRAAQEVYEAFQRRSRRSRAQSKL